jgi:hypothetical protein
MTEVTKEVIYELPRRMNIHIDKSNVSLAETKRELNNMRGVMSSAQGDFHNIFGILARNDDRLDRAERLLEPRDRAQAQARFEHDQ